MTSRPVFRVVCAFCNAVKSETHPEGLTESRDSHGMCDPICEPARKMGWGDYAKKLSAIDEDMQKENAA